MLMNSCFDGQNRGRRHNPKPGKNDEKLSPFSAGAGRGWSNGTVHRPRRPLMCLAASFLADSALINMSVLSLRVNLITWTAPATRRWPARWLSREPVGD
jgi:hypothetical protein